jgi:ParB/Sulfiredoxin domain
MNTTDIDGAPEAAAVWVTPDQLRPWRDNPRVNDRAVARVVDSIKRFGFGAPIVARKADGEVIAGHTRLKAALEIGLTKVPVRFVDLDPAEAHLLAIADNKTSEYSDWDDALLGAVLADLRAHDVDLTVGTGLSDGEIAALIDGAGLAAEGLAGEYTKKITIPVYEPKGDKPPVAALADETKAKELIARITASSASAEEKAFLLLAAGRHVVFDYQQIAEFYCHANAETQALMEASALVLIDFDKAVAEGYVQMSKKLEGVYSESYDGADDEA